jgi:ADP-ribosylglycohydrolase
MLLDRRPTRDQFAGCLIGQCLGDALGFPVEGQPPKACARYVAALRNGEKRARPPFQFGQYTDDSQLARELLLSWVELRGFSPEDYGRRISRLFSTGLVVGRGHATAEAAERLARGVHWSQSGTPAPAAGNGSAMRAAPVGLMLYDHPDALAHVAMHQGKITHTDPRASGGAIAMAAAVALALDPRRIDPHIFCHKIAGLVDRVSPEFAEWLAHLSELTKLPPDRALKSIRGAGLDKEAGKVPKGISPFVIPSILWSFYTFLTNQDSYADAVSLAISVGGDVDTTGAMAGALSGAHLGFQDLPKLHRHLTDQGNWTWQSLIALADRAWALKHNTDMKMPDITEITGAVKAALHTTPDQLDEMDEQDRPTDPG